MSNRNNYGQQVAETSKQNKTGLWKKEIHKTGNADLTEPGRYFKFVTIADKVCIAGTIIVILLSLQEDFRKFDKRYEAKKILFNVGFLTLTTAVGTVMGGGFGVSTFDRLCGAGIGSLIGSLIGKIFKNRFHS